METLKGITGFEVIKPTHKEGTEALKALHYEANKIIFKYNRRYINDNIKDSLLKEFSRLGGEIKELEVTDKAKPKKKEILEALREIYKRLYNYKPDMSKYEWAGERTFKYILSSYLYKKEKDELDIPTCIALLDNIREARAQWIKVDIPQSLLRANEELLEEIANYYLIPR